jgi:hypothetical protein
MAERNARMARTKSMETADVLAEPETDVSLVSTAPDEWEWETRVEESPTKVIFDEVGDVFVGLYVGPLHIEREPDKEGRDQSFTLYTFRGRDQVLYAINESYQIEEAMKSVDAGVWVRITYMKDIDTARGQNPMKDFRVDVRTA